VKNRPSSTIRYESTTTIDRPIDEVFARLSDLGGYGAWMPGTGLFGRCSQTSDGPVGKGTTYVDSPRMGSFPGEVTEFERPSRVAFSETLRVLGRDMMQVRPGYSLTSNGTRTVVHHVAESELFGVMRIMKPVASWMSKSERNRVLTSLKHSLEERP
jgi:uncharacterized protein YndB with AHSA1/START domain